MAGDSVDLVARSSMRKQEERKYLGADRESANFCAHKTKKFWQNVFQIRGGRCCIVTSNSSEMSYSYARSTSYRLTVGCGNYSHIYILVISIVIMHINVYPNSHGRLDMTMT